MGLAIQYVEVAESVCLRLNAKGAPFLSLRSRRGGRAPTTKIAHERIRNAIKRTNFDVLTASSFFTKFGRIYANRANMPPTGTRSARSANFTRFGALLVGDFTSEKRVRQNEKLDFFDFTKTAIFANEFDCGLYAAATKQQKSLLRGRAATSCEPRSLIHSRNPPGAPFYEAV